jgi:ABC-2 type transport system permease protein
MKTEYLLLETKRALRNPRSLIFTVVFPVLLFFIYRGLYGKGTIPVNGKEISTAAFLMVNMAAFGGFMAAMSAGARTALERSAGWQRQLRLTPLTPRGYLLAKGGVAMIVALPSIALVSLVGFATGIHLSPAGWLQVVGGLWLATLPFAALGLLIGQLANPDSLQVYSSGIMLLFGLLGGLWIPVTVFPQWIGNIAKVLPSYWLANIGHGALAGNSQLGHGVLVLGIWLAVLSFLVLRRYQRDSARV